MTLVILLGVVLMLWLVALTRRGSRKRARRKELDWLLRRESAMAAWTRMIDKDRKF